jgi:preprotein translocase subunit SecF
VPTTIVPPDTHIDFIGKWKLCVTISLLVVAVGVALAPFRMRWGIDFAGGTEIWVRFTGDEEVTGAAIRQAANGAGVAEPSVVRFGDPGSRDYMIRFAGSYEAENGKQGQIVDQIQAALEKQVGPLEVERVESVGPRVGAELREDGIKALSIAFLLILIYIAFRFTPRFAPGAVIALVHDVLVTSAIWVMLGEEFDLQVLAALLAIIGYSLNDTIIVYDRIRENMELRTTRDLPEVLNRSINQTLSRTILTSGTTMLAVLGLLFVGGEVIRPFSLAMAIGIVVGTYSSIYIASPTLLILERRYGSGSGSARESGSKSSRRSGAKEARA